jgi:hypothetical protein
MINKHKIQHDITLYDISNLIYCLSKDLHYCNTYRKQEGQEICKNIIKLCKILIKQLKTLIDEEIAKEPVCNSTVKNCEFNRFIQTGQCSGHPICVKGYSNIKECPYYEKEVKREEYPYDADLFKWDELFSEDKTKIINNYVNNE